MQRRNRRRNRISHRITHITENETEVREQMSNSHIHPDSWIQSARDWINAKQTKNNK